MKNILKSGMLLFFCLCLLCSCEKEDDTFMGKDHFISSFVLEKDGTSYVCAITDGAIEITVPSTIDLTGSKVEYVLCEQASITPDPATVTNWGESQKFTVTSYNNVTKEYTYTVTYTQFSSTGDVKLSTQADVAAFAQLGVNILDGNLIIGEKEVPQTEFDTIKTLEALSGLTKITGNIVINNTYGGADLKGLENIAYAGNIYIGNTNTVSATIDSLDVAFNKLTTVAGEVIINSTKVKTLSLPTLSEALYVYMNIKNTHTVAMPALSNVYGDFIIQSGTSTSTSTANAVMETLDFSALQSVGGVLTVQSFINLTSLGFPKLQTVVGDLSILNLPKMETLEMAGLTEVGGLIKTSNLNKLNTLDLSKLKTAGSIQFVASSSSRSVNELKLGALETVNGQCQISYLNIASLALDNLKTVNGRFYLQGMNNLTVLNTPAIETCTSLYFYALPLLEQVDLSKVDSIASMELITSPSIAVVKVPAKIGSLTLNAGSRVMDLPVFEGVNEVTNLSLDNFYNTEMVLGGFANNIKGTLRMSSSRLLKMEFTDIETIGAMDLSISACTNLSAPKLKSAGELTISGGSLQTLNMPALETIGTFEFSWESTLQTLSFPRLRTVGDFEMTAQSITDFDLPLLTEITGTLKIAATSAYYASSMAITHLNGFSGVTKIGNVEIKWCNNLFDFSGLSNAIGSLSASTWSVTDCKYNPTYQDMVNGKYKTGFGSSAPDDMQEEIGF